MLGADAVTANPLLGRDALEPVARPRRQAFVLVRTSNPGAAELQDAPIADGATLSEHLAAIVDELGASRVGESGLSDVGAVVGATAPEQLERLRELHAARADPRSPASGPRAAAWRTWRRPGSRVARAAIVSASRSIARAHETRGGEPARAARAEAEELRAAAWSASA